MRHLDYTTLFRTAAEKHQDLRHTKTDMHFGRLILTGWPLTKLDVDETWDDWDTPQPKKSHTPSSSRSTIESRQDQSPVTQASSPRTSTR